MLTGINYRSSVITAAGTTVLGAVGGAAAAAAQLAALEGQLHTVTIGADTAAATVKVYDNTAGSGTLLAQVLSLANSAPVTLTFDAQANTGLAVVVTGGAAPNITITYK